MLNLLFCVYLNITVSSLRIVKKTKQYLSALNVQKDCNEITMSDERCIASKYSRSKNLRTMAYIN